MVTLPETNSLPLKMDDWKMKYRGMAYFKGAFAVSFRVCNDPLLNPPLFVGLGEGPVDSPSRKLFW